MNKKRPPERPVRGTATCDPTPGRLVPVIKRNLCDGERDCAEVCPFDVFIVRKLTWSEWWSVPRLSLRLALLVLGNRQAFTPNANACQACGLCVRACPHKAVALIKAP